MDGLHPRYSVGRPYPSPAVSDVYGRLLGDGSGLSLSSGLDLDALRLYLHWRGSSLATVRAAPETYRNPANCSSAAPDDPWGVAAFLSEIDGNAYGTTPDQLRSGLEQLCSSESESVWITPGIPFIAVIFVGVVSALIHGDLLATAMEAFGLV